jgi:phthiocerol/phenolphthiocerol synthesis type-I polyketide synthase E
MLLALQEEVIGLIQTVTGNRAVALDQNLFSLGIDSLRAAQIVDLIQDRFDVELDLEGVFELPTVNTIVTLLYERLLAKVEAMTDEEVLRALQ